MSHEACGTCAKAIVLLAPCCQHSLRFRADLGAVSRAWNGGVAMRIKSLLIGCVGGLIALTSAQAADLPVKAKPVEYVKICSLYGVGFYYIPGTDICMKLGGYVRFQQNFGATDVTGGPFAGVGGLNNRVSSEDQSYRVRWLLQHDTRQQTAYGTLRTYMILGFSQDSGTDAA